MSKKRALVTGAAGFIGSHLVERLLDDGWRVVGVDAFTAYYPRAVKERNLAAARGRAEFTLIEGDLLRLDPARLLDGVDCVFHQAAQPGVRASWGERFAGYVENNVLATQRLLEAAKGSPSLRRFVYASSSSVYGDAPAYPLREDMRCQPMSPYGVTKLAAEHLCVLYARSYGVPTVSLRYFTVYGPRQRPDMAFNRFIRLMLRGEEVPVYGDGTQVRDFTFVADVVRANLAAAERGEGGAVLNVGGGRPVALLEAIRTLEGVLGVRARLRFLDKEKGDVPCTVADTSRTERALGFRPAVGLAEGLAQTVEWFGAARLPAAGRPAARRLR